MGTYVIVEFPMRKQAYKLYRMSCVCVCVCSHTYPEQVQHSPYTVQECRMENRLETKKIKTKMILYSAF